jgi:hypothetical protein
VAIYELAQFTAELNFGRLRGSWSDVTWTERVRRIADVVGNPDVVGPYLKSFSYDAQDGLSLTFVVTREHTVETIEERRSRILEALRG